ncbi:HAD-IA family hydrolase [Nitratireductor sp. CAU 1489]|uniref:HAD-IA family hydrolase n=1 Tax=Nitratireductor arenosus TaxID=2682096 RepID=A0A844QLC3_9HYPH|nr:HAD family phosphatase [Nitratireductor arenosus]MVA98813.1 HAD-IA family hydrolase [Nitratireductor arenosus]
MQPELVIFDCDGVLVDSEVIAARVEAQLITEAGFPITGPELAERYAGLTFRDILLRIEEEASIPLQASLLERAEKAVDRALARQVEAVDGAPKAVLMTTAPRCICSNSSPQRLEMMLTKTGLKPAFADTVFSAEQTPERRPKPAPDVFLFAAERMRADPANTFVVEDSAHGIAGAKAAGMRVIGFTGGRHSYPGHADVLTEAGAETVIGRWADFQPILAALSQWSEAR